MAQLRDLVPILVGLIAVGVGGAALWFFARQARGEPEPEFPSQTDPTQRVGEFTCDELRGRAGRSASQGHLSESQFWTDIARLQGCAWAQ